VQVLPDNGQLQPAVLRVTAAVAALFQGLPSAAGAPTEGCHPALALPLEGGTLAAMCRWVAGLGRYEGLTLETLPLAAVYETERLFGDRSARMFVRCLCLLDVQNKIM
jgi:hypothetical protein